MGRIDPTPKSSMNPDLLELKNSISWPYWEDILLCQNQGGRRAVCQCSRGSETPSLLCVCCQKRPSLLSWMIGCKDVCHGLPQPFWHHEVFWVLLGWGLMRSGDEPVVTKGRLEGLGKSEFLYTLTKLLHHASLPDHGAFFQVGSL